MFEALLDKADFAGAAAPFRAAGFDRDALLASMLSAENLPMMANNARIPAPDEMADRFRASLQQAVQRGRMTEEGAAQLLQAYLARAAAPTYLET